MKRCVIIGGAQIRNPELVRSRINADDFLIFCDSGLRHMQELQVQPDLIVGDFDSHRCPDTEVETIVLPREKDDTDTVFGVKEALRRGFDTFLLVGVIGARLDHTLGNVSILLMLSQLGKHAQIIDDYSEMEIVAQKPVFIDDSWAFFSLLNISGVARGVCIEHAKYPLQDAEITCAYPYGISNEVLPGERACVSVKEGCLLLIRVLPEQTFPK